MDKNLICHNAVCEFFLSFGEAGSSISVQPMNLLEMGGMVTDVVLLKLCLIDMSKD